jgi:hypothetical protein
MLEVSEVKTVLNISGTGDDTKIEDYIKSAYASLPLQYFETHSHGDNAECITEKCQVDSAGMFYVRSRWNTIEINTAKYWTGTAWATDSNATTNITQVEKNRFYYPTQAGRLICLDYSPSDLERILAEVVLDLVVYEYVKQYNKDKAGYVGNQILGDINISWNDASTMRQNAMDKLFRYYNYDGI